MLEAVGSDGYERASVQVAIERAGIYRQAFYDEFSSKEDCYLQALEAGAGWAEAAARAGASREATWRGKMRGALRELLGYFEAQPDLARALVVEVHAAGPRALEIRRAALERAARQVDLARGEGTEAAPAIAGEGVVAGILAVLHARLARGEDAGLVRLLPDLAYLAVLPYFGAAEAAAEMRLGND
ncbi:MAG TPA: hypothetical protein VFN82_05445 [Solirubrobacterales bacterium]|nr:hypothetical protein [Solirubrobacterales bacterium]